MIFPDVDRYVYKKNPLQEVICQIKFPPILRIDSELPSKFQEKIRHTFPYMEEKIDGIPNIPKEIIFNIPKSALFEITGGERKRYVFFSSEKEYELTLTRDFIALSCKKYNRWEEFKENFYQSLSVLLDEYTPSFYTRIGLRYINFIDREELSIQQMNFSELLQNQITGIFLAKDIREEDIIGNLTKLEIKLDFENAIVRIIHGLKPDRNNKENIFLIDNDLFVTGKTEIDALDNHLGFLKHQAHCIFRWTISDKLHTIMEPNAI